MHKAAWGGCGLRAGVRLAVGNQRDVQQTLMGPGLEKLSSAEERKGSGFPGLFLKEDKWLLLPGAAQQHCLLGSCVL